MKVVAPGLRRPQDASAALMSCPTSTTARSSAAGGPATGTVPTDATRQDAPAVTVSITLLRPREMPVPTVVFDTYWRFAAARQEIFNARLRGAAPPWTDDPILQRHRFTNAYRVLDRVSQYLVGRVIPAGSDDREEVFFRTMLFKLFNKIETWERLADAVGETPSWQHFDFSVMDTTLTEARAAGDRIYSAAYIMPAASQFGRGAKHRTHLRLLEWMMTNGIPERVGSSRTMGEAFEVLRGIPSFGDFLAYQLVTDLNYSSVCDFSEMEFVQPGPGALDGIAKCFSSLGGYSAPDLIRWVADFQDEHFEARGLRFARLSGRPLQLIDCQNVFCEVDKYARLAHPEIAGRSGRTRIKQVFAPAGVLDEPALPPKWGSACGTKRAAVLAAVT